MEPRAQELARQIRALCVDGEFSQVSSALKTALAKFPKDASLLTEQARYLLYQAREQDSLNLLQPLPVSESAVEVAQHLANYLGCVVATSQRKGKADASGERALQKLWSKFGVKPSAHTGIKISACLIVKNEEANLDRCLSSLKGIVGEIVVVDTGSTDSTIDIARRHGAILGDFEWRGDFSAARNVSLDLATGNWILWIDADEELVATSDRAIRNAVQRPHFGGFSVEIVNFTADGNDQTQYTHSPIRLFQNLPGVRFTGRIHEQICHGLTAKGLPGASLEGARILHYGYRPAEMDAKGKVDRTIELLQKEVLENPTEAFQWFNLCNAFFVASRWPESEHAGRQCCRLLRDADPYGALNYQLLIGALANQGKLMAALRACDEAAAKGYGGILVDFERANVHIRLAEPEQALEAIDRCMAADWPEGMTGDRSIHAYKRHIVRGQALAILGRSEEALEMFDCALSVIPGHAPALYSQGATLETIGEWPKARESFLQGRSDPSVRQLCTKGAARVSLRLGLAQESAELFREAWEAQPDDYDCWVGWTEAANAWGNSDMIVAAYESFVERHEPTVEILINWGRALQKAGYNDRAMALFTEALRRDPKNANAYFNCGDLLYSSGQFHDAAHIYEAGLRQDPNNADGWFVLGNCFARMEMAEGARLAFNQAILLDPSHQAANYNLECLAA